MGLSTCTQCAAVRILSPQHCFGDDRKPFQVVRVPDIVRAYTSSVHQLAIERNLFVRYLNGGLQQAITVGLESFRAPPLCFFKKSKTLHHRVTKRHVAKWENYVPQEPSPRIL